MKHVTIYHNPRCSKSRETLTLIQAQGIEPTVVLYLDTPPSTNTLKSLLTMLHIDARELLRKTENEYKELKLDNEKLSDDAIIKLMAKYPKLIERPIVVAGKKAVIGRPPEKVLGILK